MTTSKINKLPSEHQSHFTYKVTILS